MTRDQALNMIFRRTHPDFRGCDANGNRSIMLHAAEGGGLCPLDDLTDAQITNHLPAEYRRLYHPETSHG